MPTDKRLTKAPKAFLKKIYSIALAYVLLIYTNGLGGRRRRLKILQGCPGSLKISGIYGRILVK